MKTIRIILLSALLISTNGCISYVTVKAAKGEESEVTFVHTAGEPKPGYYALLPLTVPADIATSPIQALCLAWVMFALSGGLK